MNKVILGHPYSGGLYGYFSDQIGGKNSHTVAAKGHPYYRTLYGTDYKAYVDVSLTFLLLYDQIWMTPADNHMPVSKSDRSTRSFIEELGLHSDWDDFHPRSNHIEADWLEKYLTDPKLCSLFTRFKIPQKIWKMIIESARYEASLSVRNRCPLLCSPGRRAVIYRMIEIDRPALYPIMPELHQVKFIKSYQSLTGVALQPKNLDDLMAAKPDNEVRKYGARFLSIAQREGPADTEAVALLIREAMDTQRLCELYGGLFTWAGKFSKLVGEKLLGLSLGGASSISKYFGDQAGWYEFSGKVNAAISRDKLLKKLETHAHN